MVWLFSWFARMRFGMRFDANPVHLRFLNASLQKFSRRGI